MAYRLTAAAALICASASPAIGQVGAPVVESPVVTVVAPRVAAVLDRIQRTVLEKETAACLHGRITADSTVIERVSPAVILSAGPLWVNFMCAEAPDLVGTAHNHPPGSIGCAVSVTDLDMLARSPTPVAIHSCTAYGRTALVVRRQDRLTPAIIQ